MFTEQHVGFLRSLVSITAQLREESWQEPEPGGFEPRLSAGRYGLTISEAAVEACERLALPMSLAPVAALMLTETWNEACDWSEGIYLLGKTKDEPKVKS